MSTWKERISRKPPKRDENEEILMTNSVKYRRKLQSAINQIRRTKKTTQRNFDSPDSEIHVARLTNDFGQLSGCKQLQEISGLIDSLAMRSQLSSKIFNEYSLNSLEQSFQKLNDDLLNNFDKTKCVYEQAKRNFCSDRTRKQILGKAQNEWSKHKNLATKEFKQGLTSYCDIALYNLKIQISILEKFQNFVDQLSADNDNGLPNFSTNSIQVRREIDTMLRIMLDTAPNNFNLLPTSKRPKFLSNHLNSLYSPEITEAVSQSNLQIVGERNTPTITETNEQRNEIAIISTVLSRNDTTVHSDDNLPSYTDLFIIPSNCKSQ